MIEETSNQSEVKESEAYEREHLREPNPREEPFPSVLDDDSGKMPSRNPRGSKTTLAEIRKSEETRKAPIMHESTNEGAEMAVMLSLGEEVMELQWQVAIV